jgi:hypothetical protein
MWLFCFLPANAGESLRGVVLGGRQGEVPLERRWDWGLFRNFHESQGMDPGGPSLA